MIIVKSSLNHIPAIQKIAKIAFYSTYKDILSLEQIDYMMVMMYSSSSLITQMTEMNNIFLLLQDNLSGRYEGFVSYELDYKNQFKTKIHKLYLYPENKGKRLGRLLVEAVIADAKINGNTSILLNMNRANPSYGFYKHLGFKIADIENIDIGNGFLMEDYVLEFKL